MTPVHNKDQKWQKAPIPHNIRRRTALATTKQPQNNKYSASHQASPSLFWRSLSKQWLTSNALVELERTTAEPTAQASLPLASNTGIDKRELKRLSRHGGPDLSGIRNYPNPEDLEGSTCHSDEMDQNETGSNKRRKLNDDSEDVPLSQKSKKSASPYDKNFEQALNDGGICLALDMDDVANEEAANIEQIRRRLEERHSSLSGFSKVEFTAFQRIHFQTLSEGKVSQAEIQCITDLSIMSTILSENEVIFNNLEPITTSNLAHAKPDMYDGARPGAFRDKQLRDDLARFIQPSTESKAPCLPNFFMEWKGPKGEEIVVRRQAIYDGALGARAIHELRSSVGVEEPFDRNAYTISVTYHGGNLTFFATHPVPVENSNEKFPCRITVLDNFGMIGNMKSFIEGASYLRNAREWAQEQRNEVIKLANQRGSETERMVSLSHPSSSTSPSDAPDCSATNTSVS